MSTTAVVNVPFTGISQYASDYQAELNKAVQVANIPLTQLQTQDTNVLAQKTALGSLNATVADLTTSLTALGTLASSQALGATSSNTSAVTATATGATAATSYTINSITSVAAAANETSTASYTSSTSTPVSTGTMTLAVGGVNTTIKLTSDNLNSLSSQINAADAGVTASVVTANGSSSLSIVSNTGAEEIQLFDGASAAGTDLLTNTGTGTETSTTTYADPTATPVSTGTLTLLSGSTPYTFQLTGNNLTSLRDQINAQNAGVTASILTTSGGNYLSIAANNTGATTLKLYDGPSATGTDLLSTTNQGANAVFHLNGISITQAGNTVNSVIPGVTLTLQAPSATATTITLASDPTQLSSALQDFVTKYNAVATAVAAPGRRHFRRSWWRFDHQSAANASQPDYGVYHSDRHRAESRRHGHRVQRHRPSLVQSNHLRCARPDSDRRCIQVHWIRHQRPGWLRYQPDRIQRSRHWADPE